MVDETRPFRSLRGFECYGDITTIERETRGSEVGIDFRADDSLGFGDGRQ
jgi:hypothetical protein